MLRTETKRRRLIGQWCHEYAWFKNTKKERRQNHWLLCGLLLLLKMRWTFDWSFLKSTYPPHSSNPHSAQKLQLQDVYQLWNSHRAQEEWEKLTNRLWAYLQTWTLPWFCLAAFCHDRPDAGSWWTYQSAEPKIEKREKPKLNSSLEITAGRNDLAKRRFCVLLLLMGVSTGWWLAESNLYCDR